MRLSTLLALVCLVALGWWSKSALERPMAGDPLSKGMAEAIDGDSLRMKGQELRLKGIDAPEYSQTCTHSGRTVACGKEAAAALRKILARAPVTCVGYETDRYGRLLVACRSLGADIAAMQVRAGMAVAYGDYLIEEAQARNAGAGIWAGDFEPPQEWRARHRERPQSPPMAKPADVPSPPSRP